VIREPFPTVESILAVLPPPAEPREWDPPLDDVLRIRRELAEGRLPKHQGVAARARRTPEVWEALEEWRSEHAPAIPFVSPTLVEAVGKMLAAQRISLGEWMKRRRRKVTLLLAGAAQEELEMERDWFRLAEAGYRALYRARALVAALREATNPLTPAEPLPEEGIRLYRLLAGVLNDLESIDAKLSERYDSTVWKDDGHADEIRQVLSFIDERLRYHNEWAHDLRRSERIRSQQGLRRNEEQATRGASTETCAEPGCIRSRHFWDENGIGWCKRHGNARGLRPHGKVA
jgi:hypothetical protein